MAKLITPSQRRVPRCVAVSAIWLFVAAPLGSIVSTDIRAANVSPADSSPAPVFVYDSFASSTTPIATPRVDPATTYDAGSYESRRRVPACAGFLAAKAGDDASSTVRHYTTSERARQIEKSGEIRPGASGKAYFTPDRYSSATDAQRGLALPTKPEGYFEVPLSRLRSPSPMRRVDPNFGQPGGGLECTVTCPTDVSGLRFRRVRP